VGGFLEFLSLITVGFPDILATNVDAENRMGLLILVIPNPNDFLLLVSPTFGQTSSARTTRVVRLEVPVLTKNPAAIQTSLRLRNPNSSRVTLTLQRTVQVKAGKTRSSVITVAIHPYVGIIETFNSCS
jgi:hypothetical protein